MLQDTLSHKKSDSRPGQIERQTGKEEEIEIETNIEQADSQMYCRDRNESEKETPCANVLCYSYSLVFQVKIGDQV